MQANVFTDKALERYAGQFVWLSVDTEKSSNANFLKKYTVEGYPSFYVIDPAKEKVALRWMGGATVAQMAKLFEDGRRSVRGKDTGVDALLTKADKLYGEGKNAEAAKAYEAALAAAPATWSRYGRATESLLIAQMSAQLFEPCALRARDSYPRLRDTSSAANVAATGLDCALSLDQKNTLRSELVKRLELASREVLTNPRVVVAADDRSGVYQVLIAAREDVGDEPGQERVTREWASFLDAEAAKAKTPQARMVFDSHRLGAYLALHEPEKAVEFLQQSQRDAPDDYNPPARLASAYLAMKKYDEAIAASDRALELAYGPRKLGIYRTRAQIFLAKGDRENARKAIDDALALNESFPQEQRSEGMAAQLKKMRESVQ